MPIFDKKEIIGVCGVFDDITSDIVTEKEVEKITNFHGIIGGSEKMQKLYVQIKKCSQNICTCFDFRRIWNREGTYCKYNTQVKSKKEWSLCGCKLWGFTRFPH